ncbi:hypothetical protein [Mesorhizobium sp. LNHC252B00]|uniref:hypothetical protein n=1 Tax=Mesorhizobium sp. LNHC252B00 TaxID=1287252 RepID=UPI0018DBEEE2|nr:hypothetical protein [Mesorhizobium sp. LNHC252B00]
MIGYVAAGHKVIPPQQEKPPAYPDERPRKGTRRRRIETPVGIAAPHGPRDRVKLTLAVRQSRDGRKLSTARFVRSLALISAILLTNALVQKIERLPTFSVGSVESAPPVAQPFHVLPREE